MEAMATFRRGIAMAMRFARRQRLEGSECGSAILETAFAIIILITFLFGLMETCLMLYTNHFISEAAREGTRYAIVRGSTCTGFASACPALSTDVTNYVKNLGFPGIDPAKMTVAPVWSAYVHGNTCGSPCNSPGNLITVTVTYNFPLSIPFVPAQTFALTSTSAMVISQ